MKIQTIFNLTSEKQVENINNSNEKLLLSDVSESVCDNCEPVSGFYLGMTCQKCNKPFRNVKQTVR